MSRRSGRVSGADDERKDSVFVEERKQHTNSRFIVAPTVMKEEEEGNENTEGRSRKRLRSAADSTYSSAAATSSGVSSSTSAALTSTAAAAAVPRLANVHNPLGLTRNNKLQNTTTHTNSARTNVINLADEPTTSRRTRISMPPASESSLLAAANSHSHTEEVEGGRGRRTRKEVDYRETNESGHVNGSTREPVAATPSSSSTRAQRASARHTTHPRIDEESQSQSHDLDNDKNQNLAAGQQRISRQQAREMGISFEELQQLAGDDEGSEHMTRRSSSRRAPSNGNNGSVSVADDAASASADMDESPQRRSGGRNTRGKKRIREEEEEEEAYEEEHVSESDDDDDDEEEEAEESYGRPRRVRKAVVTYADEQARELLARRRADDSESDDGGRGRREKEQVMTSYYREIPKEMKQLADGRVVSDREYRQLLRSGEQVQLLGQARQSSPANTGNNAGVDDHDDFGVRRSTRNRQQVVPFSIGGLHGHDDSGEEEKAGSPHRGARGVDHRSSNHRRHGRSGGRNRRSRSGRGHSSRPVAYYDSDSALSSSSASSDSTHDDHKESRRMRKERNAIQPLHVQIQHALKKMENDASAAGLLGKAVGFDSRSSKTKDGKLADVDPIEVDTSVDWKSIGGLDSHINALKEMVVLPLLYPELFERFHVEPPKGVLFYGPPGTGKTLVARALANTCSATGQKVSFFMRKGSDCLSKWVGEAERQLRLLFEQAHKMQPSIIFFDELDGLAPVRSSRQDQIHASIVSTLLALMDGLDSRGQVIVIGATNRVDSIDPALRRPGRFDRELMFALPNKQARRQILEIHTREWKPQPDRTFIHSIADLCVGYCGADLRALCTEATLRAVRRRYPQIYSSSEKLLIEPQSIHLKHVDFIAAMQTIVPASQRSASVFARSLTPALEPLLNRSLEDLLQRIKSVFPLGSINRSAQAQGVTIEQQAALDSDDEHADVDMKPSSSTPILQREEEEEKKESDKSMPEVAAVSSYPSGQSKLPRPTLPLPYKPRLLIHGNSASAGQSHLGPAVLHHFEEYAQYSLDLPLLLGDALSKNAEESCVRIIQEAKRNAPSLLYWPHIDLWWSTASESLQNTALLLLTDLPPQSSVFLVATADCLHSQLPEELLQVFPVNPSTAKEADSTISFAVPPPTSEQIIAFFQPILAELIREIPRLRRIDALPSLPVLPRLAEATQSKSILPTTGAAATTAAFLSPKERLAHEKAIAEQQVTDEAKLSATQLKFKCEQEDSCIRLQRMALRGILTKLIQSFPEFEWRVSLEDCPDYLDVIAQSTCLQDIVQRNNEDASFDTIVKFCNEIDLVVSNCKEYSAHCKDRYRALVNKACHLQDTTLSMTSQIETKLIQQCEEISKRRAVRLHRFGSIYGGSQMNTPLDVATGAKSLAATVGARATRSKGPAVEVSLDILEKPSRTPSNIAAATNANDLAAAAENGMDVDNMADIPEHASKEGETDEEEKKESDVKMEPSVDVSASIPTEMDPSPAASALAISPTPVETALPPAPAITLTPSVFSALQSKIITHCKGKTVEQLEQLAFQFQKIVVQYQREPNRDEAVAKMSELL